MKPERWDYLRKRFCDLMGMEMPEPYVPPKRRSSETRVRDAYTGRFKRAK
jgi:hypothetical protein